MKGRVNDDSYFIIICAGKAKSISMHKYSILFENKLKERFRSFGLLVIRHNEVSK